MLLPILRNLLTSIILIGSYTTSTQAETLLIGRGDAQYPPFEWIESGELTGIHIDLLRQAAQNLGIAIEIKSYPWSRGLLELKEGRIHALTFMSKNPEREKFTIYHEGNILSNLRLVLFSKKQKLSPKFNGDLKNLDGKSVAIHSGYSYTNEFDNASNFEKREAKSYLQMLKMVSLERADFGIINHIELLYNFGNDPQFKELEVVSPAIANVPSYLGFSKRAKTDDVAKLFAQEVGRLRTSNFYKTMMLRYGLSEDDLSASAITK